MRAETLLACLAIAMAAGAAAPDAAGQAAYPARAVRMIVPFPPGGGTDITSRTVARKLNETWGQLVIVDNRGGANGIIGSAQFLRVAWLGFLR